MSTCIPQGIFGAVGRASLSFPFKNLDRVKCPHWPILLSEIWAGNCDLTPHTPLQGAVDMKSGKDQKQLCFLSIIY